MTFVLLDVKRILKILVLKIQSLGKNYVYINQLDVGVHQMEIYRLLKHAHLTKLLLDNMLVEDDKRES